MSEIPFSKYADMLDLPHPDSKKHPRMKREMRAAQFMPFAALTGYEEVIEKKRIEHEEEVDRKE